MTPKEYHTIKNAVANVERNIVELVDIEPIEIGIEAQRLDIGHTLTERMRLPTQRFAVSTTLELSISSA